LNGITRRDALKLAAAGSATMMARAADLPAAVLGQSRPEASAARAARMQWWHDARFGMFVHWGVYSTIGRHEWVMENEGIPTSEYEPFATAFRPKPNAPRDFARLAKRAGQHYIVMTTKHHEGFCLFDTKTTSYCAPKQGPGRDLVREYVDAARAEGLRVGFYYSLMDWHHPDGARCATDEAARRRFVDYLHAHISELLTNYGKIDVLWYDVAWPLDAKGFESERMNDMVFTLQPEIIVNNRNKLEGDFSTPEQRIEAAASGRAWETCMTLNGSWGYHANDTEWKTPKAIIRNLITCCRDGGNYLLNIGPRGDGSIPEDSVRILETVGGWLDRNKAAIYTSEPCQPRRSAYAMFTRAGNTLYMHIHAWPGDRAVITGLLTPVKSARLLAIGQTVRFQQEKLRTTLLGLPRTAPDAPLTTIAIECDGEPKQDNILVRNQHERLGV